MDDDTAGDELADDETVCGALAELLAAATASHTVQRRRTRVATQDTPSHARPADRTAISGQVP